MLKNGTVRKLFFSTDIYLLKDSFFTKMYFVKKQSYSKCCWRIQLVFILKLFNLFKCFLAYFLISKIKHALPYVTDAFIDPISYKQIGCCFHGPTSCSLCCKSIYTNKQVYVRLQASVSFCLISRLNIFLRHVESLKL